MIKNVELGKFILNQMQDLKDFLMMIKEMEVENISILMEGFMKGNMLMD